MLIASLSCSQISIVTATQPQIFSPEKIAFLQKLHDQEVLASRPKLPKKLPTIKHVDGNLAEKAIEQCHLLRQGMEQSLWHNMYNKASYYYGTALNYASVLFKPVQFVQQKTTGFLYNKMFSTALYFLKIADARLNPPAQTRDEAVARQKNNLETARNFTDLIHWGTTNFAFVNNSINTFSNKLVNNLVGDGGQQAIKERLNRAKQKATDIYGAEADRDKHTKIQASKLILEAQKDEVAKQLFARFEGNMPTCLQNGNAYKIYKNGADLYDLANETYQGVTYVYKLVDNVTAVLSLSYQLTNHAQKSKQTNYPLTFHKVVNIIDIARRCAETYLDTVNYFDLNSNESNQKKLTPFQNKLWWFVRILSTFMPKHKNVAKIVIPKTPKVPKTSGNKAPAINEKMLRQMLIQAMLQQQAKKNKK